jgi:protein TonB
MRKIISIGLFLFTGIILSAQTSPANHTEKPDSTSISSGDSIQHFSFAEVMPAFPGDAGAYQKYLANNVKYPAKEMHDGKQGTVYVKFVVEKDGVITGVRIAKSSGDDAFDKEAIRVFSAMPNWTPGQMNGRPVRVEITEPLRFVLQ